MTEKRIQKFKKVIGQRQPNLTIILENVHDPHNIGAVLRSCDSVGVCEIFVCNTEAHLQDEELFIANRASSGARKWVKINFYTEIEACFAHVRSKYDKIWATHLSEDAHSLYKLDLTQSVALLFGNEHAGISTTALAHTDGNFIIPQMGMVESLNISVACAVSLYEALRQRSSKNMYENNDLLSKQEKQILFDQFSEVQVKRNDELGYFKKLN